MGKHSMDMSGKAKMMSKAQGMEPMAPRNKPAGNGATGPRPKVKAAEMGSGGLSGGIAALRKDHSPSSRAKMPKTK